jgi:hypothetical protein
MEVSSPETLLVFIVVLGSLALGLTVWLLRYVVKGRKKKEPASSPAETEQQVEQASVPPPAPEERLADAPAEPVAASRPVTQAPGPARTMPSASPAAVSPGREPALEPGDALLMQVLRDREGFLVVAVEGQRYRRLFEIRDGEVGRWVMEIINRLVAFSKGQKSRVAPPPSLPVTLPPADEVIEERSQALFEQLQPQAEDAPRKARISMDPVPFRRRSEAGQSTITLNLAGEIDQLLQIRVRALPEFSGRYVHVANAPDGGLRFDVDGGRYGAIDEIPDQQVQALIRAAIAEWEAKR